MDNTRCNICKSDKIEPFMTKNKWNIVRCNHCGLVFLDNIPSDDELKNLYDDEFFKDGQKSPIEGTNYDVNPTYYNALKRLEKINKFHKKDGKLLDIGCATGIFIKAASKYYECTGLDVSNVATDIAVNELGVNAKCGTIFDFNTKDQLFDIVTMWDVIEHVRDPDEYIAHVSKVVNPGGLLVVSTGNIESLMFKIQKKNWHLMIPPFHLYYFNKTNLTKLLESNGFEVKSLTHDGQYTNVGYITNKLKKMYDGNKIMSIGDNLVKILKLDRLNIYLNLFDVMTVYAVKKG